MLTLHEVAEQYGVSDPFMVLALEKLGFTNAKPGTQLPAPMIARFEKAYGDRIRSARPNSPAVSTSEPDADPLGARRTPKPKPQVMRVAHARITAGRDAQGNREKRLLPDPGTVHAIDAVGTWEGDPWNGEVVPGAVHFFGGPMNSGPRAACGLPHMRAVLGEEFVPQQEPVKAGQCPKCAQLVADDQGFRNPPGYGFDPFCHGYLQVKIDGMIEVQNCSLRSDHRGPHRTREGATWDVGFDDFVPAPLDINHRIARVS